MNKNVRRFYTLVSNNNVLIIETNLKRFYEKVLLLDIGLSFGLSTLRKRFIDNNQFAFSTEIGTYYFQKTENNTSSALP